MDDNSQRTLGISSYRLRLHPAPQSGIVSRAENRGADIGVFLQQLLLAKELNLKSDLRLDDHIALVLSLDEVMLVDLEVTYYIKKIYMNKGILVGFAYLEFTWLLGCLFMVIL